MERTTKTGNLDVDVAVAGLITLIVRPVEQTGQRLTPCYKIRETTYSLRRQGTRQQKVC